MISSYHKSEVTRHVRLFVTPWTVAYQASPSMGFSRQVYWSGVHFLLQGIFPSQGSNPGLLHCRQTLYPLSKLSQPNLTQALASPQATLSHHWDFSDSSLLSGATPTCASAILPGFPPSNGLLSHLDTYPSKAYRYLQTCHLHETLTNQY